MIVVRLRQIVISIAFIIGSTLVGQDWIAPDVLAQNAGRQSLPLTSLSAFSSSPPNWRVVQSVSVDRAVPLALSTRSGSGVLVNLSEPSKGNLATSFSHADLALDLEVLLPADSDAGLLLQGRYELQLADSWGKRSPGLQDMGSVSGVEPAGASVARAPGLWQKVSILFRAPRFDASGKKISNAAFVRVALNGVVVQEEVELQGPTPGAGMAAAADGESERARAQLVFQGDAGPVAFRSIRYALLDKGPVSIENLTYDYFRGDFGWELPNLATLNRTGGGPIEAITSTVADTVNNFAVDFQGDLVVPAAGTYRFEVTYTGQFALVVDGETVVDIQSPEVAAIGEVPRKAAAKQLTAGKHSFELEYARGRWHVALNALGLYVGGPGSIRTRLSAADSDPDEVWAAFKVDPGDKPRLQRGFVAHPSGERVHAISVGYPNGNHYAYDTGNGSLLHVWRGRFIDTSTMWFSRGNDQLAAPQGSLIEMSGLPTVVSTEAVAGATDIEAPAGYRFGNYRIDADGNPVFSYTVGNATITDALRPDAGGRYFVRTLTVSGSNESLNLRLADATTITSNGEGIFTIADGTYQIEVTRGRAAIQKKNGAMQLVATIPAGGGEVEAAVIW